MPAFHKPDFARFRIYNSGVQSVHTHRLARLITDRIFAAFQHAARSIIQDRRPLLISGGCGLNCEWNRAWQEPSLFTETFVPPCANDTGSAVGSAADAQLALTGNAKLSWTVYCGQEIVDDADCQHLESIGPCFCIGADLSAVASALHDGAVIAWISGRAEMGPRALGNRSLLAAPFAKATLHRLNEIKRREGFRPIAPGVSRRGPRATLRSAAPESLHAFFRQGDTERDGRRDPCGRLREAADSDTRIEPASLSAAPGVQGPKRGRAALQYLSEL